MNKKSLSLLGCIAAMILFNNASATAPNTTAANSVPYEVGQGWVTHYFDESIQTRWFKFGEIRGRSYCVEAVQGSVSPIQLDPNLSIFSDASGLTLLSANSTNNDGAGDPYFLKGARFCYISPLAGNVPRTIRSIKLNIPIAANSGDAGNIRLRIVETTMFADIGAVPIPFGYEGPNGEAPPNRLACNVSVSNISDAPILINGANVNANASFSFGCVSNSVLVIPHNGAPGAVRGTVTLYVHEINSSTRYDNGYAEQVYYLGTPLPVAFVPLRPR
jgi:hypothetical protein